MFFKHIWPSLVWALFILFLCAIPGRDLPQIWWMELLSIDKLIHATLFAIFIILLIRGFYMQTNFEWLKLHRVAVAMLCAIPYGFLLELMQRYCIEGRTFDLWDAAANTFGCIIGYYFLKKKFSLVKKIFRISNS